MTNRAIMPRDILYSSYNTHPVRNEAHALAGLTLLNNNNDAISNRIARLEKQWSLERAVQVAAATTIVAGLGLAAVDAKGWLMLSGAGAILTAINAAELSSRLLPWLRCFGLRPAIDIQVEHYALKLVRGDFASVVEALQDQSADVDSVLDAVRN